MTKFFNAATLGLTLAASVLTAATPVAAQSFDAPTSVSVRYGELNIAQPAGAKVLFERIKSAASRACGGQPDNRLLGDRAAFDQCRRQAIQDAVTALGSPRVAALANHEASSVRIASR